MKRRTSLLLSGCLLILPATLHAQVLRSAPEFQVNAYTTGTQTIPAVARGAAGGFVVVWSSYHDGDLDGIFGRRFDGDGMALGGEFQVNQYTTGQQNRARIASDSSGKFVVVWHSYANDQDGDGSGVFGRLFDGAGTPLGNEFQLNTYTTGNQVLPAVTMGDLGDFVVVWNSFGQDGDDFGVFARRFDATGAPLSGEFQVNTYTTSYQVLPDLAADADGDFMIAWTSTAQDGDNRGVFARPYDSSGAPLAPEFQVNTYTTGAQSGALGAAIASYSPGAFVIAWGSTQSGDDGYRVVGRRFDETGAALSGEFSVNTYTTGDQYPVAIVSAGDGEFIVTWASNGQDGSTLGSFAKRFTTPGNPFEPEFQVNEFTTGIQTATSAIQDAAGNILFASISDGQDGDGRGIFAQRFVVPRLIRGKRLTVKDPDGTETARTAVIFATERQSDLNGIAGSPVVNGATLRVIISGTTPSDETYELDAAGWTTIPTGFIYGGPTGIDGDPVRRASIRYTPAGTVAVKVLLRGDVGTQPMNVVPPNTGFNGKGGFILKINGAGSAYCTAFGLGPGGYVLADSATIWRMTRPGGEDCP
jgi:hypothetical protein